MIHAPLPLSRYVSDGLHGHNGPISTHSLNLTQAQLQRIVTQNQKDWEWYNFSKLYFQHHYMTDPGIMAAAEGFARTRTAFLKS